VEKDASRHHGEAVMTAAPLRVYDLGVVGVDLPDNFPVGPAYERASDNKVIEAARLKNGEPWLTRGELFIDEARPPHGRYRQLEHFKLTVVPTSQVKNLDPETVVEVEAERATLPSLQGTRRPLPVTTNDAVGAT